MISCHYVLLATFLCVYVLFIATAPVECNTSSATLPSTTFSTNNATLFKHLHLSHASTKSDITFVVLTNKGCSACTNFHPMWNQAIKNLTKDNKHDHRKYQLKPHFVWVECASASDICSSSSIFSSSKIAKYPFFSAFLTPREEAIHSHHHHRPNFFKIDGEEGLKVRIDKRTGQAKMTASQNNNQQQQQQQEEEPDSDEQQVWNPERLLDRIESLLSPHFDQQPIKQANQISQYLLDINENEPSTILLSYFPSSSSESFSKSRSSIADGKRQLGTANPCTKITSERQQLNRQTKASFREAASFFSLSSEEQYKFIDLEDGDENTLVALMLNGDLDGSQTNFHEVSEPDDEYNKEEADDEQEMYLENKLLEALSPENKVKYHLEKQTKKSLLRLKKKHNEAKVIIQDVQNTNGVVSSILAEHIGDRKQTADDVCHFLSRPVVGILNCLEFEQQQQKQKQENSTTAAKDGNQDRVRGKCIRFAAKWHWIPGSLVNQDSANYQSTSKFLNYHQQLNLQKRISSQTKPHNQLLEIISFIVANARPRVTIVTDADSDRFYPGKVITSEKEPLSRAVARPFAFEKNSFHGTNVLQDHLHLHHEHHRHLSFRRREYGDDNEKNSDGDQKIDAHGHLMEDDISYLHHRKHENEPSSFSMKHPDQSSPPIFASFAETQSCQGRPATSNFWPTLRALETLALEYQNTTFVLFDSLRYSEYYLRSGLTRPVVDKMRLGMIIMDHGRKFSVLDALAKRNWTRDEKLLNYAHGRKKIEKNFTALNVDLDNARLLLQYYWSRMIRPHGKVLRPEEENIVSEAKTLSSSSLRLKTARKVLDFVSGKTMMMLPAATRNNSSADDGDLPKKVVIDAEKKLATEPVVDEDGKNETVNDNNSESEIVINATTNSEEEPNHEPVVVVEAAAVAEKTEDKVNSEESISPTSAPEIRSRILLVESPFKEISKSLTKTFSQLFVDQQRQEGKEGNYSTGRFLRYSELAILNGEGRGALALEHLYPKRRSSMFPFFICVEVIHQSSQTSSSSSSSSGSSDAAVLHHHTIHSNHYASSPSFLEFDRAEIVNAFRKLETDEGRKDTLINSLMDLKCFDKVKKL